MTFAGIAKNVEKHRKICVFEVLLCGSLALSALDLSFELDFQSWIYVLKCFHRSLGKFGA